MYAKIIDAKIGCKNKILPPDLDRIAIKYSGHIWSNGFYAL